MKLGEWMDKNAVGNDDFAARVKTDRTTISRIRRGKQRPSWELAARIYEATFKAVGADPNDFIADATDAGESEAAPSEEADTDSHPDRSAA